jgi:Raf kinase inhibitor-like YbhB/YbcL family protein
MIRQLIPLVALVVLATEAPASATGAPLAVSSPAFTNGGAIPQKYTCDGDGTTPPITWSALPAGTRSVAVLVDDPDAPHGTFVHWVLFNVPNNTTGVGGGSIPAGSAQGKNGKGDVGWTPPCPPSGTHHYHFKVYALDTALPAGVSKEDDVSRAMRGHVLASSEIVGTYERAKKR